MEDIMIGEDGKVTFNEQEQAELDRIVTDRLSRESKKYEGHDELKAIADELSQFGYKGTPLEIRQAIKTQREAYQQQAELEELQKQADDIGITPALAKEIKELKDEIKSTKSELADILGEKKAKLQEQQQKQQADENFKIQLDEFEAEYPDIDVNELGKNEEFLDFIEGSNWSLKTAYKKFIKIHGEIEDKAMRKIAGKHMRSTSNAKGESSTTDYNGLSAEQKADLSAWNRKYPHLAMTAIEFKNK
jgi:uncharacterized protein YjiS (DUF1127 family)